MPEVRIAIKTLILVHRLVAVPAVTVVDTQGAVREVEEAEADTENND